jgi:hypothetical protein
MEPTRLSNRHSRTYVLQQMTDEAATRVDPSILHAIQTDRMNN